MSYDHRPPPQAPLALITDGQPLARPVPPPPPHGLARASIEVDVLVLAIDRHGSTYQRVGDAWLPSKDFVVKRKRGSSVEVHGIPVEREEEEEERRTPPSLLEMCKIA